MTGNIVIPLGMGVAEIADDLPRAGPPRSHSREFCAGALATRAWPCAAARRPAGTPASPRCSLSVRRCCCSTHGGCRGRGREPARPEQVVIAAAIAAVMGQQTMVARALAVKDMTRRRGDLDPSQPGRRNLAARNARRALKSPARGHRGDLPRRCHGAVLLRLAHHPVPLGLAAALTCLSGDRRPCRIAGEISGSRRSGDPIMNWSGCPAIAVTARRGRYRWRYSGAHRV